MGWFNKKENIPELPPAPVLQALPEKPQNLPELPTFHNTNVDESFNNEVIKSAVQDSSGENEVTVEELPQDFNLPHEVEKIPEFPHPEERRALEISQPKPVIKSNEPIFVRVDKFQEAKKDFEEVKKKVKDIENILKKVRDIKVKEDAEISGWTGELEKVKSRLSEIDENFFNRL